MPASPKSLPAGRARCVVDVTRLAQRQRNGLKRPSGIDRVNLQYARRGKAMFGADCLAVEGSRFGVRPLSAEAFDALLAHWPLDGLPAAAAEVASLGRFTPGADDIYFHVGHIGLEWLATERLLEVYGPRAAIFLHDVLPLSHPHFFRAQDRKLHAKRVTHALACGAEIVVNSVATADSLSAYAKAEGLPKRTISVAPLPVEPIFETARAKPEHCARPSFVMLGTIEPRKNHALLIEVWRALTAQMGRDAPELICVGRPGWGDVAENFAKLCESAAHVRWAQDLSDAQLVQLMAGARALLAPSFAEGFGLPVAEARAMGLPIIASDIPAHREVAGPDALYLDPKAAAAWEDAIAAYTR